MECTSSTIHPALFHVETKPDALLTRNRVSCDKRSFSASNKECRQWDVRRVLPIDGIFAECSTRYPSDKKLVYTIRGRLRPFFLTMRLWDYGRFFSSSHSLIFPFSHFLIFSLSRPIVLHIALLREDVQLLVEYRALDTQEVEHAVEDVILPDEAQLLVLCLAVR